MENEEAASSSTQHSLFHRWINLQHQDLAELLDSLNLTTEKINPDQDDSLNRLIEKNIQHFKNYTEERSQLAHDRACELFVPSWCSSLENSLLWIGGCRPSLFFRLVYALSGSEIESHLTDFLQTGNQGIFSAGLSPNQLTSVDTLRLSTIKEEDKLTARMASLQEEVADGPLAWIVKSASQLGELDDDTVKKLNEHEKLMAGVLEEADKLRLKTLEEVIDILIPLQAVDFLATSKKLHLSIHEWGTKRDEMKRNE